MSIVGMGAFWTLGRGGNSGGIPVLTRNFFCGGFGGESPLTGSAMVTRVVDSGRINKGFFKEFKGKKEL